jgi:hypothetical protein
MKDQIIMSEADLEGRLTGAEETARGDLLE